jgi:hypothetical protein
MPSTKNNTAKSLLIISSIENKLGETAKRLSFQARQAYVNRNFKQMKIQSDILLNLGSRSEDAGLFYQALYTSHYNPIDCHKFESLADSSDPEIRAASTLMLGGAAFRKGKFDEAQKMILNAGRMAFSRNFCAPLIGFNSQNAYSTFLSSQGAHAESLEVLQRNAALAEIIGVYFPATKGEYLNNFAYENLKLGNYEVAAYFINKALSLPVLPYVEWLETKEEIYEKIKYKKSKSISVPSSYNRQEMLGNLRHLPLPKCRFQIDVNFYRNFFKVLNYYLYDCDESENRFLALIEILDMLCVDYKTGIEIEGYVESDGIRLFNYQNNITEESLDSLHLVIHNLKRYETNNPVPRISDKEGANKKNSRTITAWLDSALYDI